MLFFRTIASRLGPTDFFLFSEARCINSDGWSSMSGFKEERIDGCFFRATYSGKGGAYDLTAHTTPSVIVYRARFRKRENLWDQGD